MFCLQQIFLTNFASQVNVCCFEDAFGKQDKNTDIILIFTIENCTNKAKSTSTVSTVIKNTSVTALNSALD